MTPPGGARDEAGQSEDPIVVKLREGETIPDEAKVATDEFLVDLGNGT